MIVLSRNTGPVEHFGHLLGLPAAAHIDYGTARYARKYIDQLLHLVFVMAHDIAEVGAAETLPEYVFALEMQLGLDILGYLGVAVAVTANTGIWGICSRNSAIFR